MFCQPWSPICPPPSPRHGSPTELKPGGGQAELITPRAQPVSGVEASTAMPRQGEFIHSPIAAEWNSQLLQTRKPLQTVWEAPEVDPTHTEHPGKGAGHKPASCCVWLPPRPAGAAARNTERVDRTAVSSRDGKAEPIAC